MKPTSITDPLEALSKWLPDMSTTIHANEHTWRMPHARTGRNAIDLEVSPKARAQGIFGYLWGRVLWVDNAQPDGTFIYRLEDEGVNEPCGGIEIGGTSYVHKTTGEPFYAPIKETFDDPER